MKITKSLIEKYINQYVYVNTGSNDNWIVFITKIDSEFVYSTDSVCLDSKSVYNNPGIFSAIQSIKSIRFATLSEIKHVEIY